MSFLLRTYSAFVDKGVPDEMKSIYQAIFKIEVTKNILINN